MSRVLEALLRLAGARQIRPQVHASIEFLALHIASIDTPPGHLALPENPLDLY
jgi:hypothetical protein